MASEPLRSLSPPNAHGVSRHTPITQSCPTILEPFDPPRREEDVEDPTDSTMATRSVATFGDFDAFYRQHRDGLVRGLGLALGDVNLAADAVDEAMTRAVQRWSKVSGFARPEAWVYRVALNWATSRFRRRQRDRKYAPLVARSDLVSDGAGIDPSIRTALAELPIDQRSVVVMRYFLDWNVSQTAEALGIADGTVKSRTSRALRFLSQQLTQSSVVPEIVEEGA